MLLVFSLTQFNLVLEELLQEQCGLAAGRDEALASAGGGLSPCFDQVSAALLLLDCPSRTAPEPEPPRCACWPQSTAPLPCLVIWVL